MLVFPENYDDGSVSNGGTISGVVTFEGDVPEMKVLEITKDQAVCGATEKYDESVVVGEGNALKNTIVYLIDTFQKAKVLTKRSNWKWTKRAASSRRIFRLSPSILG